MSEIKLILSKSDVSGVLEAPSSKSLTHRAIICAALADGTSKIYKPLICDDTLATIEACKVLGTKIFFKEDFIEINGISSNKTKKIPFCKVNCRQSGSTMRFIIPICAFLCDSARITGDAGLTNRPILPMVKALKQLDINIISNGQHSPVFIRKNAPKSSRQKRELLFRTTVARIAGNISSQYISGLLFALPLLGKESTVFITTEVESKDYILMTLDVLKKFGIKITSSPDLKKFIINGKQKYNPVKNYKVEGDYSAGAFLFAAGLLASKKEIVVKGLKQSSLQGDAEIVNILKQMGGNIHFSKDKFVVKKSALKAIKIDAKDIPDLAPILAVLATQAKGKTIIKNIERLRIKESNRASAITSQLKKMGADIVEKKNYLEITGPTKLRGAVIDAYGDHRIAMACAIASLVADGDTLLCEATCVKKSYPDFFDALRKLGVNVIPFSAPFGKNIKLSIYGDSHGKKVGALVEGIPAGIKISNSDIQKEVDKRKSVSVLSTPRKESDKMAIIEGIKNGCTNGETIKIEVLNKDINFESYERIKDTPRPGHADFTARAKYASVFDYRGGGFLSGRMTVCMVAAGAVAKKILRGKGIKIAAYAKQIGNVALNKKLSFQDIEKNTYTNPVKCPDEETAKKMAEKIKEAKNKNDSIGGIIECIIVGLPIGLGEPLFNSAESALSQAMFSIPAIKAVEFGSGFSAAQMSGSQHNDSFSFDKESNIITRSNNAGGILGGITNGMPVIFRVAVKPTASIGIEQDTVNLKTFQNTKIKVVGRHDPCIAIRVPPIVEAMAALSILDLLYRN